MATLDQLQAGQRGLIDAIDGDAPLVQRLLEMGLLEGDEIEVVGFAPLGDPMEVRLRDYRLSLRRSEAAHIAVTPMV
jgi:Fe2+ transport system protein FeoA